MSSSGVCQGLQSCLEPPRLIEPRVLRLKLAPPSSNFSRNPGWPNAKLSFSDCDHAQEKSNTKETITDDELDMKMDKNVDKGCWDFLPSLTDTCNCNKNEHEREQVYVHPMVKRSSSMLSGKSLEMCTESLGCETGSNARENGEDIALFSPKSSTCSIMNQNHTPNSEVIESRVYVSKRLKQRSGSFLPPLSSITELGGVQVRPHREDGRLILTAVTNPSPVPVFQAERSNGRLILRLFKPLTCYSYSDSEADDEEEIAEMESKELEHGEDFQAIAETEAEELEENTESGEGEMGIRKLPRTSRCMEGGSRNKGLLNQHWETFWVAT